MFVLVTCPLLVESIRLWSSYNYEAWISEVLLYPWKNLKTLYFVTIAYSYWNFLLCCTDIDECAVGIDGCSHSCNNTVGSFVCTCNDGYELAADGTTCIGKSIGQPNMTISPMNEFANCFHRTKSISVTKETSIIIDKWPILCIAKCLYIIALCFDY